MQRDLAVSQSAASVASRLESENTQLLDSQADLESRLPRALSARGSSDARTAELSERVAELETQLAIARGYQNSVNQLSTQSEELLAENLAFQTALTQARSAPRPTADWQNQR